MCCVSVFQFMLAHMIPVSQKTNPDSLVCLQCILMYADDLLLMSGSLHNLQLMIDIFCCSQIEELDLVFNPNKCQVIRIGSKFKETSCTLHVSGTVINYVTQLK